MNENAIKEQLQAYEAYHIIHDNLKAFQSCNNFLINIAQSMLFNYFQNINVQALDLIAYLQENLSNNLLNNANNRINDLKFTNSNNFNQNTLLGNILGNQSKVINFNEPGMICNFVNKQSDLIIQNIPINNHTYMNDSNKEANNICKNNPSNFQLIHPNTSLEKSKFSENEKQYLNRNKALKEKFFDLKSRSNKKYFQVVYMFKNKIKRMYRIDCMTRKINVNFYHYVRENHKRLNLTEELVEFFRNNIRYTSRSKFLEIDKKYPYFKGIYDEYLQSERFKKLILNIKLKYDDEYLKLFFRHSRNFLNFYLKGNKNCKDEDNKDSSSKNQEILIEKNSDSDFMDLNDSYQNEDMDEDEVVEEKKN